MATQVVYRSATSLSIAGTALRRGFNWLRKWPVIPAAIVVVFLTCAVAAPVIAPHDPLTQDLRSRLEPPMWLHGGSVDHILGTDAVGRDIFSRIIYGARISVTVAAVALSTGFLIGAAIALVAGYYGGLVDEVLMRLVDVWYAIPFIFLALIVAIIVGQSFGTIVGLLAASAWTAFVRIGRADVLSIRERDYVQLARVAGASDVRILLRHVLPGVMNNLIVIATIRVGQLILAEATLSYLGVGIPAPTPAWGVMISDGQRYLSTAWWVSVFPGIAIFLVVIALNFFGDWFRDYSDPTLRQLQG